MPFQPPKALTFAHNNNNNIIIIIIIIIIILSINTRLKFKCTSSFIVLVM